jgi:transcriptional regulator with XRE-family HTH domain
MSYAEDAAAETALGVRLREAREVRGLSLKAVEIASEGSIPASMLGSYERGEHSISAQRLWRLARLYGLDIEELAAPIDDERAPIEPESRADETIRFEVRKLERAKGREARALRSLVEVIEERRHRHSPQSIELRHEDLVTAAATLGRTVDSFVEALRRSGVLRRSAGPLGRLHSQGAAIPFPPPTFARPASGPSPFVTASGITRPIEAPECQALMAENLHLRRATTCNRPIWPHFVQHANANRDQ